MKDYKKMAEEIVRDAGGLANIQSVTNCMTRLRLVLKDQGKANIDKLKSINGVQTVVVKGGQTQVVIGTDVGKVCEQVKAMGSFSDQEAAETKSKESWWNRLLGLITGIFQPVIPAICGAGMIKAVLAICTAAGWLTADSQTYILLNMFADCAFYFLPIYLGFSAAKKMNVNPYVAAVACACLIHPTFTGLVSAGEPVELFAMPIKLVGYGSAVVPPILIVWVLKYVDLLAKKITPDVVKVFMVPLIDFLIVCPLALLVVGPLGSYIGDLLYIFFDFLNNEARWVIPVIMGAFCPLLVMTGMHYSLMPVQLAQYATLGYGTLLGPGMLSSNLAQAGSCFAVALRTKDKNMRSTALSSGTTALFGITEPALYGVTMKLKTPLWAVMIAGGLAGLWGGLTNMRTYASAAAGVLALPVYVAGGLQNVINAVICIVIALVASFIITLVMYKPAREEAAAAPAEPKPADAKPEEAKSVNKFYSIAAPVSGKAAGLESVPDDVFSKKVMGDGIAIVPENGSFCSPVNGTVEMVFPTGHAIGLKDENGVELLIHIGIDTVELNGKGFTTHVKQGDKIKTGQKLVDVDLAEVEKAGYSMITPVIVTNTPDYLEILEKEPGPVKTGEEILKIFY